MDEATKLNDQALKLLGDAKVEAGMKLVRQALDLVPTLVPALDNLGATAAMYPARYADELFARADKAVAVATSPAEKSKLQWYELRYAAFFNRIDVMRRVAAGAASTTGDDDVARAELGALLFDIGDKAGGERLLHAAKGPAASYHLGRLAVLANQEAEAKRLAGTIPPDSLEGLLHDYLLAQMALHAGRKVDATPIADKMHVSEAAPEYVLSEGIVVRMQIAQANKNDAEVKRLGGAFGLAVQQGSPSSLVRATAVAGPLFKFGAVK